MNLLRLFLLLLVGGLCSISIGQDYVFNQFDTKIKLAEDGDMVVRETLVVTFTPSRRGIFRTIPIVYDTGKGVTRRLFFSLVGVKDETGKPYETKVTFEGGYAKIRIGSENLFYPPGATKTYVITYTISGAINWFDKDDEWEPRAELYWNVTGDEHPTIIENTSFQIEFPETDPANVRLKVIAGAYGSTDADHLFGKAGEAQGAATRTRLSLSGSQVSGSRDQTLYPGEGMTVVLGLAGDLIKPPPFEEAAKRFLFSNLGFFLPLPVLAIMLFLWMRFGRDPCGGPTVVQYDPPYGLSGSEVGALIDERVDQRDIVAGIITLAVKGYLKIAIDEKKVLLFTNRETSLVMTGKVYADDLGEFEVSLLTNLEGKEVHTESDLRTSIGSNLLTLHSSLYRQLVKRGYYLNSPSAARTSWTIGGIVGVVVLGVIAVRLEPFGNFVPALIGGALSALTVVVFGSQMPKRTREGSKARALVLGFEEFIRRARGQELDWMSKKDPNMMLFESYLPHATAFGLADVWAEAFQGVLTEAPNWYVGPHGSAFHYAAFTSDLSRTASSLASASTPPRSSGASGGSSGFGGGGFSGGGFGGGGSGSW